MPIVSAAEFKSSLAKDARILGLDISKTSIGVAFADLSTDVVTPLKIIPRTRLKDDASLLARLIEDYNAAGLVVGWPLNMDGTEGTRCQAVKDTIMELSRYLPPLPFVFHDERNSTQFAYSMLEGITGKSLKNNRKAVDSHAALIILTSFIDGF